MTGSASIHIICFCLSLYLSLATQAVSATEKTNHFNDDNYRPTGAHNIIPGIAVPKKRQTAAQKQKSPAKQKQVRWSWTSYASGDPKNRTRNGVFYYHISNYSINTTTVCNNYPFGSLIFRDCRKAAKRYFNEQCSSRFPQACVAAGMTP